MAGRVPARLTTAEGRRFGFTVGAAFVVIGLVLQWRGNPTASMVTFALGGVLIAAGLVIPGQLGPVERAWMGLAHAISKVTTPIFMAIVYFGVLLPTGLIRRMAGRVPMDRRKPAGSRWVEHPRDEDASRMERQF